MKHTTSFVVMPKHLNYMGIIFGGVFMSELDLASATVVNRAIRGSRTADKAVTHKFEVEFMRPCFEGDIVTIQAEIVEYRKKAIVVEFKAQREPRDKAVPEKVAVGRAVFVAMNGNQYVRHGLSDG